MVPKTFWYTFYIKPTFGQDTIIHSDIMKMTDIW